MIKKLLSSLTEQRRAERKAELYRNLIRHEARIGGQLFGDVPAGTRREFFCLDEHTWVWHEEWTDQNGAHQARTTRYDVRPNGIIKSQNGTYSSLSQTEAQHLIDAISQYGQRVQRELYAAVA